MSFVSIAFLILFSITFLLYCLMKDRTKRQILLLLASYTFYAYWDVRFLSLMIFQTFVSYWIAMQIDKGPKQRTGKQTRLLAAGIVILLSLLGFFKYFNFFTQSFCTVLGMKDVRTWNIILPVGISFYTFQALSYLMDVYRGEVEARKSFLKISMYISFFPQLVAGPIVRSTDFLFQLDQDQKVSVKQFMDAMQIFMMGLIKKVVIADRLAVEVDAVFSAPAAYNAGSLVLAVVAYAIQIYCDFSGYTDMAIGVAKAFGYDLCLNFNLPYLAKSVPEFWRRWHISLGTWFRDYLMYPVQRSSWCQNTGRRLKAAGHKKAGRFMPAVIASTIVWTATGLWHGAAWTFVAWGVYYGILLILSMLFDKPVKNLCKKMRFGKGGWFDVIRVVRTNLLVCIGYVFFRAENFTQAFLVLRRIVTGASGINYPFIYAFIYIVLVFAAQIIAYRKNDGNGYYICMDMTRFSSKLIFNIVLLLVLAFAYVGDTAFIYFQF